MATIFPFPGLRYNAKAEELASLISPPYDKISPAERKTLWERSDRNVVRLILPPPDECDADFATQASSSEDWYGAAAKRFRAWIEEGVLKTDEPRLYVYRQTFSYLGRSYTRTGLFTALQLDDEGGPLAHEHTFEGPKADRLRLMNAAHANMSPIFLLSDGEMQEWDNLFTATDGDIVQFDDLDGQRHEIASIAKSETLQTVQNYIRDRVLVIADGHHRYETAQNYKRKMMEETGENPEGKPWGSVLAFIVPAASPDLLVLPTHRVITQMPDGWMDRLESKAADFGTIEPIERLGGEALRNLLSQPNRQESIAVIGKERGFLFTLDSNRTPHILESLPGPLRKLNVSILHQFLFESCLNLTPTTLQGVTRYIRSEDEAIESVQEGKTQAAFLLGGLSPQTVLDVSQHNVRMPQKSTDFYPKIPTGLLFRSLADK